MQRQRWMVGVCGLVFGLALWGGGEGYSQGKGGARRAGTRKTFVAGGVAFAMRWIPAGSFVMGSPIGEAVRCHNEGPQRRVWISRGFWMLESEVTQGQYKALMGYNLSRFQGCGWSCPVEMVSWEEARIFAEKLSKAQGLAACTNRDRGIFGCVGWRLPTEAEWEYAARAGTKGARHGGISSVAWYRGNSGGKTHPVGMKRANRWGLKDMLGNVWEWTMDVYGSYEGTAMQDPLRTSGSPTRTLRGGSWRNRDVRSAFRGFYAPRTRGIHLGFRLVRY